jgi:hypothetical protein
VSVFLIIHTDSNHADVQLIKLALVLRELAQLAHAEWSPVTAIEDQQKATATLVGKAKGMAFLIAECELRRGLPLAERALWFGQLHLGDEEDGRCQHQKRSHHERNAESAQESHV